MSLSPFKESVDDSEEKVKSSFYQISLDVNRTFPNEKRLNRDNLTLLLRNIVNSFVGIGYTQGMNFYAGFLLLCGFTVQESYYVFHSLFTHPKLLLSLNFSPDFKLPLLCTKLLSQHSSQKLAKHLQNTGIS